MAEIARINGISVSYRRAHNTVLRDVSFVLNSEEIFGLLGPNGAGKTTLIRSFCGRVTPTNGQITVAGYHPGDRSYHHQIGLAPQDIALFSHMTARENLTAFARMAGLKGKARDARVHQTMAATQIDDHHDTTVENLSGGWKRRVNIAAAMVSQPRLLILDEPTVGVDLRAQLAIEDTIRTYTNQGNAALITTHDMEQAERLCDRVGLLSGGRLVEIGAPHSLLKKHFADQQHVSLRLAAPASQAVAAQLTKLEFQNADPTLWTRLLYGSGEVEIASARALGVEIREVRLRAPNLGDLMQALTGAGTTQ